MKTTIKGNYSFRQSKKKKVNALSIAGFLLLPLALVVGTQWFAWDVGRNALSGQLFSVAGVRIYAPWAILDWMDVWQARGRGMDDFTDALIAMGGVAFVAVALIGAGIRKGNASQGAGDLYGSAQYAEIDQIREAGLLPPKGKKGSGVYVGGWIDPKDGRQYYLRHSGKEHVIALAPTRSGKGVGLVIPTLLSWEHSVVVLDIKGENWALTSGWRKQSGHKVLRWDPTDAIEGRSARYDPLEEIRIGTVYETSDVMNVATLLVDPDGKGVEGHWEQTARSLLIGAITHVIYRARNEGRVGNLSEVLHELTSCAYNDMAEGWKQFEHKQEGDVFYDPTGAVREEKCHPVVEQVANEMLNRAEEEASSVLSTAVAKLGLYTDPIVARNTAKSDFRIKDIMDADQPVSLYLVLNPTNIQRLKPLVRLFLSQLIFNLMPEMEFSGGQMKAPYKHRLLLLLDEFPALGKLGIFEQAIAYFGGWNIKAYLICQDKAQLDAAYGKDESITSNCHITIAYAPNKVDTAKYLSDRLGVTTVIKEQESVSYQGGGLFAKKSISKSQQEVQRAVLTPDEIMRLPGAIKDAQQMIVEPGDMLIFAAGFPVIYGKQILYFLDRTFSERSQIDAPPKSDALHEPAAPTTAPEPAEPEAQEPADVAEPEAEPQELAS
ncbi:MAG: type IV secretory system conjugative DNA transfer family protein [Synergistaceae bacterium]|nr:type IV secretory system conjugative DNA transfer family protein [Synergistaceae bacterium]